MYYLSSNNFCNSLTSFKLFSFIGYFINFIQIIIPIILILIGSFELIKVIINTGDTSKYIRKFIKKLIFSALIFFVPIIVKFIMWEMNQDVSNACIDCISNPSNCSKNAKELEPLECPSNQSFKRDINCTDETCKYRDDCKKIDGEWKCCIGNL